MWGPIYGNLCGGEVLVRFPNPLALPRGKSREVGGDKNNRWTTDRETDPLWSAFINPLFALLICITSSYSSFTNTLQAMIYILLLLAVLMVLHWILSVTELHLVGTALHILGRCVAWCWSGIGGEGVTEPLSGRLAGIIILR